MPGATGVSAARTAAQLGPHGTRSIWWRACRPEGKLFQYAAPTSAPPARTAASAPQRYIIHTLCQKTSLKVKVWWDCSCTHCTHLSTRKNRSSALRSCAGFLVIWYLIKGNAPWKSRKISQKHHGNQAVWHCVVTCREVRGKGGVGACVLTVRRTW